MSFNSLITELSSWTLLTLLSIILALVLQELLASAEKLVHDVIGF